jgi:hypothetical protein
MLRPLDDLALLKEVDRAKGGKDSSQSLKKKYPHKVIIINHMAFIKKDILCDTTKRQVTDLSNYVQLSHLAEKINTSKKVLLERIYFMEKTSIKLFDYIKICDIWFINIDDEFKNLLIHKTAFMANLKDIKNITHLKCLGDIKVGFY